MENLKNYTDEQLREELKRRIEERRKNTKREIVYIEFEATVDKLDNQQGYKCNGDVKYKAFVFWKYRLKDCSSDLANSYSYNEYYIKQGCFKRDNAPQVGDVVKLRYRRTKSKEVFDLKTAKIVEIIKKA